MPSPNRSNCGRYARETELYALTNYITIIRSAWPNRRGWGPSLVLPSLEFYRGKQREAEGSRGKQREAEGSRETVGFQLREDCQQQLFVFTGWAFSCLKDFAYSYVYRQETFQDIPLAVSSFAAAQDRKRGEGGLWGLLFSGGRNLLPLAR